MISMKFYILSGYESHRHRFKYNLKLTLAYLRTITSTLQFCKGHVYMFKRSYAKRKITAQSVTL